MKGAHSLNDDCGVVVIGRNEGHRLQTCLESVGGQVGLVVYVDSGSSDGSVELAASLGASVVELDSDKPFTAARARNAGFERLESEFAGLRFVQFVDGDCELDPGWLKSAFDFLCAHELVAVVCGRRRERYPDRSVYNLLCDMEWNTVSGETRACGGDAMMRADAFSEVRGFREDLIAGEEPELCVRLRAAGWRVWRLTDEMTLHDAAMSRFSQWWMRAMRAGYAFAEGASLHGKGPDRHWVRETASALFWGCGLPLAALFGAILINGWWLALLAAYPLQVIRLAVASGEDPKIAWIRAFFLVLGKFPESLGAMRFLLNRINKSNAELIEYK